MKLTFRLRFHTRFGQELFLTGEHDLFGGGDPGRARALAYRDAESWETTVDVPAGRALEGPLLYNYLLREPDGTVIYDSANGRGLAWILQALPAGPGNRAWRNGEEVLLIDSWNDTAFYENAFYTEPFQKVLLRDRRTGAEQQKTESRTQKLDRGDGCERQNSGGSRVTHTFRVKAPLLAKGQTLCLVGSGAGLRGWNTASPVLLERNGNDACFSAQLDLNAESFPLAYRYGVFDLGTGVFVRYEDGGNRILQDAIVPNRRVVVNDGFAALPSTTWKGAGVAIPVFSLRSEASFGVGEFTDLKLLADWAKRVGLKLIQILPVNDTTATHTWMDSYPYAAISAFALHPLYMNLGRAATRRNRRRLEELEEERRRLNAPGTVDYEAVLKAKLAFLKEIYPSQKGPTFGSRSYQEFFEQNRHWLAPYAVFCHLRDRYGTADFNQWPAFRQCKPEEMAALAAEDSEAGEEVAFHYFIQYHLHLQLREASEYAHANGVILKGDIPIGVYRYGADAWQQPELYHLEMQAGAPPDAFAVKGQNWGFPTYNWPRMKEDGFAWWKRRFEQMSRYFDAFRIDHILGFFRIWSVPMHAVEGIMGRFVPALPVRLDEFHSRGIPFERNRCLKPYITGQVLSETFGPDTEAVRARFLEPEAGGHYTLKPEFATQRQIEGCFAAAEPTDCNRRLKEGLFDLVSNVLLFEEEGSDGREFHFRFGMESTASFKNLESHVQGQLRALYLDYFYHRQDGCWMREAWEKLPALRRVTNLLVCGEDLGLVPGCVPEVMRRLGLLSLEIQRMPKQQHQEFFRPGEAPYLSVVTPSTHDMSTIRGWWEEDAALTQRFYNRELSQPGEAPGTCEAWINRAIVVQHLESPAMWSIFQLQDLLGLDGELRRSNPAEERINVPAGPKNCWKYRMHLTLESLLGAERFNADLESLVVRSGRADHP